MLRGLSHPRLLLELPDLVSALLGWGRGPNHDANQPECSLSLSFLFFLRVLASLSERPPMGTCLGGSGENVTDRADEAAEPERLTEAAEPGRLIERGGRRGGVKRLREPCEGRDLSDSFSLSLRNPMGGEAED